jgi:hypothetical protein
MAVVEIVRQIGPAAALALLTEPLRHQGSIVAHVTAKARKPTDSSA